MSSDRDAAQPPVLTTDPVCGMSVDPARAAGSAAHEGQTYYFCSTHCLHEFHADPRRYATGRPYAGWTQHTSPLEKYRRLQFPPKDENFAKGWQERVALEYGIINAADLKALKVAVRDENPFMRAIAARALGILGDKDSADALAKLVKADKEYLVRIRAVESLGYLKMKAEVIQLAIKD